MILDPCPLDHALVLLNEMLALDPVATQALVETRVHCTTQLAAHPSIQVAGEDNEPLVGLLGVLNGIFGTYGPEAGKLEGWGPIAAMFETDGTLIGFKRSFDPLPQDAVAEEV